MRRYLELTRSHSYSLLFAVPLLLFYEVGAARLAREGEPGLRNGADVLLRTLLAATGIEGTLAFTAVLLACGAIAVARERRRRSVPLYAAPFAGMAAESVVYALLFGVVVGTATQWVLGGVPLLAAGQLLESIPLYEGVVLSLGAGIYEELVFRVLLVGGIMGTLRASGLTPGQAGLWAAVAAALVFSGFHYVGPFGDPWALPSFLFRFLAGLAFSALFLLRGFGITAWTHALYDVFLLMARP